MVALYHHLVAESVNCMGELTTREKASPLKLPNTPPQPILGSSRLPRVSSTDERSIYVSRELLFLRREKILVHESMDSSMLIFLGSS